MTSADHRPVRLFAAVFAPASEPLEEAAAALAAIHGPVVLASATYRFEQTRYYEREMGADLLKRLVAFERPVDPTALVDAKLAAIDLEREIAAGDGRRLVNVDPGYLTEAKVVLATRKDRGHRVYLGRGVFAEATLEYRQGDYRPFPWTYADYRTEVVLAFFRNLRAL